MDLRWTENAIGRHSAPMGAWLAFLSIWFGVPVAAQTVDTVDVADDRITIRLDAAATAASSFVLAGPDRLVVDLDGVRPGGRSESGGGVRAVRQGTREGGSRIAV